MKVNWFSPLPPAETEIAHHTARIARSLAAHMDVQLWTDAARWDQQLERIAPVRRWTPSKPPWLELHEADLNIYNIGNNCVFHETIWELSRQMPGVVILHDTCLQHLFAEHFLQRRRDKDAYEECMARFYGLAGLNMGRAYVAGACNTEAIAAKYPLTELAIENSLGVIAHSRPAFEELRLITAAPTLYADLPYEASPDDVRQRWEATSSKASRPPYRLTVFGYLGPNRRLESVIQALGGHPQRDRFQLNVYGRVWDPEKIKNAAERAGIQNLVRLHGFVDDIDSALAASDIVINLRYPSMGEASASQLRIWDHGLPSLVTRTAWYASLPEDTVAFVTHESEIEDIRAHLTAFLDNPGAFASRGARGRAFLDQKLSPNGYASAIARFLPHTAEYRKIVAGFRIADRVGSDLKYWASGVPGELLAERAAACISSFLNDTGSVTR
jgi:glycosyltransferase involved in cell wall biosynthesis